MRNWPPDTDHIGRSWASHDLEDACPCPQAPCGLVPIDTVDPTCTQHPFMACKTIRQAHPAEMCPGGAKGETVPAPQCTHCGKRVSPEDRAVLPAETDGAGNAHPGETWHKQCLEEESDLYDEGEIQAQHDEMLR